MNIKESELDYITECLVALRENRVIIKAIRDGLNQLKKYAADDNIVDKDVLLIKLDGVLEILQNRGDIDG